MGVIICYQPPGPVLYSLKFVNAEMAQVTWLTELESLLPRMAVSCMILLVAPTGVHMG